MSTPADSPAPAAKRTYSDSWASLWQYAAAHGIRAAAERAVYPGGQSVEEIEARLRQILGGARQKAGAA